MMGRSVGEVNQFHSGTAPGDAITNEMVGWRAHLRGLGYRSEIYAQHIAAELADTIVDIREYEPEPGSVLFLHHSMGHDILDAVIDHPHRIITVYHNITPVEFIDHPYLRRYARLGHEMLTTLARHSSAAVADSNFNRREMLRAGFPSARVIPVRTEFATVRSGEAEVARSQDWLFVGRLFPSKGQVRLVDAFADSLSQHDAGGQLVLVGDVSHADYVADVELQASRRGIAHRVRLTGKVSDEQLAEEYAHAGLFVSMSVHEGFGVPLLEAMAAGLPVVAYDAAAIAETMGGAGVLVPHGDASQFIGACVSLLTDDANHARTVQRQRARIAALESFDVAAALEGVIEEAAGAPRRLQLQVQGPFETSYSLAMMNRDVALALDADGTFDVSIHATEGPGDYEPKADDLLAHPEATELYRRSVTVPTPDLVIRQMYPPRVNDSPGGLTFQHFGWEESLLPSEHVADFNRHLDGIGVMSAYVRQVLRDSGVNVPIQVVGNPVRRPDLAASVAAPEIAAARSFRFLHLSSAFPRKGVDLLLDAYFAEFDDTDDVSLVLKTFPNPHNQIAEELALRREAHPNPPDVIWIDRDMGLLELDGLYAAASALVHPARGEGFGLPVAEAMLARVPVIAPASTGMADFVDTTTATVVPHRPVPARTHLSVPGSMWEEPDAVFLQGAMRHHVASAGSAEILQRVENAAALIERKYTREAVAANWRSLIDDVRGRMVAPHIAMVSTWNARCGIAEYSAALVESAGAAWRVDVHANRIVDVVVPELEEAITRDWISSPLAPVDEVIDDLERSSAEIVHVQHNFGFIGLRQMASLIERLSASRPVVITLHRTEDLIAGDLVIRLSDIARDLAKADRIIVHQDEDAKRLHDLGLDRVTVIPIGAADVGAVSTSVARKALGLEAASATSIVATYGFLLPHKGTLELIRAIGVLRDRGHDVALLAVCALHPDPTSAEYERVCLETVARLGLEDRVRLVTDYLRDGVSRLLLSSADVIALPYHETSESSSASLRSVLPIGRPVVATDIAIFADARGSIALIDPPPTAGKLADAISNLLGDADERDRYGALALQLSRRSNLGRSVALHTELYHDVLAARRR